MQKSRRVVLRAASLFFYIGERRFSATQDTPRARLHGRKNNPRKYRPRIGSVTLVRDSLDGRKFKQKSRGCHLAFWPPRDFPNSIFLFANSDLNLLLRLANALLQREQRKVRLFLINQQRRGQTQRIFSRAQHQ